MYFAIVKITFEDEPNGENAGRDLHTLTEKLRSKFKVCAAAVGDGGVAITALASTEEKLTRTLDAVVDFCEESGFGRVASEEALLDHIDALAELSGST